MNGKTKNYRDLIHVAVTRKGNLVLHYCQRRFSNTHDCWNKDTSSNTEERYLKIGYKGTLTLRHDYQEVFLIYCIYCESHCETYLNVIFFNKCFYFIFLLLNFVCLCFAQGDEMMYTFCYSSSHSKPHSLRVLRFLSLSGVLLYI